MKLTNLAPDFIAALPILKKIEAAGYEAYFVGGSVRDALLALPIHDVDIASSAYPEEIKTIFERTVDTGIQHGTVMVLDHGTGYEVTTFRTESAYQDFRRPDHVTFVRHLADDLKRRDFTINALAMRHDGEIIDLYHGLDDLQQKLIRAVGTPSERFHEDALRMLRAVRFESQLDFKVEPATTLGIAENHVLLAKIAIERIHVEFVKMMLGRNRRNGLQTFIETELYQQCPGLATQKQALLKVSQLPQISLTQESSVWLILLSTMGFSPQQATPFLRQWKSANELIDQVTRGLALIQGVQQGQPDRTLLYQTGSVALAAAIEALALLRPDLDTTIFLQQYQALQIHDKSDMQIDGKQLMQQLNLKPGPQLGQLLRQLEQLVVTDEIQNTPTKLLAVAQAWLTNEKDKKCKH